MISSKSVKLTHCKRGHPRTEENIYKNLRGTGTCKICQAMNNVKLSEKRKLAQRLASERRIPRDLKQVSA